MNHFRLGFNFELKWFVDLWLFYYFIELFSFWDVANKRGEKKLGELYFIKLYSEKNGCNIVDGEWMAIKFPITNKRYFFQENSHHLLQVLLVCVHGSFLSFVY